MRVITGVVAGLVLLIGLSFGSYRYINKTSQNMISQFDLVEKSIQDGRWETAKAQLQTAENTWDQTKYWWTILLNHQEIDNIDVSISRLKTYISSQGLALSLGEVSALKMYVDHISDTEAITVRNIL